MMGKLQLILKGYYATAVEQSKSSRDPSKTNLLFEHGNIVYTR